MRSRGYDSHSFRPEAPWVSFMHRSLFFGLLALSIPFSLVAQIDVAQGAQNPGAKQAQSQARWANWRGPTQQGVATGKPPLKWSEEDGVNIKWKVETPGIGISTPIVWGDYLYFTTAIRTDAEGEAPKLPALERRSQGGGAARRGGRFGGRRRGGRRRGRSAPLTNIYDFALVAMKRSTGEIAWKKVLKSVVPHERGHSTGSLASNSPVTDGTHVYAYLGSRGLHCLTMQVELVWSKDFGLMRTRNQFGEGSSPALHGDTIVINWDHEGDSFILALDKKTGKQRWRRARDEVTSWATPRVFEVDGNPQVVVSGTTASRAYDLASGDVVWTCSGMTTNAVPTPVYADGVVYLMSGYRGSILQAIKLSGAKGDLREGEGDQLLWEHGSSTSYVPSAMLYRDRIWFTRVNTGRISCLNAKNGEVHYEAKSLPGIRSMYASPIAADGRVYWTSRNGLTVVIDAGKEFKELAANQVDDQVDASLVVIGDEIFMRGRKKMYCIARID